MVPALVEGIVEAALAGQGEPFVLKPNANNPNRKWRWLIPLAVAAQAALVKWVFLPAMRHDDKWGDQFGPWDKKLNWVRRQEYNLFVEGKEVPKKETSTTPAEEPAAPAGAEVAPPEKTPPPAALEETPVAVPAPASKKKKTSSSSSGGKKSSKTSSSSGSKTKKKTKKKRSSSSKA